MRVRATHRSRSTGRRHVPSAAASEKGRHRRLLVRARPPAVPSGFRKHRKAHRTASVCSNCTEAHAFLMPELPSNRDLGEPPARTTGLRCPGVLTPCFHTARHLARLRCKLLVLESACAAGRRADGWMPSPRLCCSLVVLLLAQPPDEDKPGRSPPRVTNLPSPEPAAPLL